MIVVFLTFYPLFDANILNHINDMIYYIGDRQFIEKKKVISLLCQLQGLSISRSVQERLLI